MSTAEPGELKFYEWDYDELKVRELRRSGECNGCGACCIALIRFRYATAHGVNEPVDYDPREGGSSTTREGVWQEVVNEQGHRKFYQTFEIDSADEHRCSSLTDDKKCDMHERKSLLCRSWPHNQAQVDAFAECSYSFEVVNEWAIDTPTQYADVDEKSVIQSTHEEGGDNGETPQPERKRKRRGEQSAE